MITPIQIRRVGEDDLLDMPSWPTETAFASCFVEQPPDGLSLRFPYLALNFANAGAVYRLEDGPDLLTWRGHLVEGWVKP